MFVYTVHKYELWIMLMMHWQATDGFFNKLCWSWILLFIRLHWFVRTPIRIVSFQSWCIVFQFFLRHLFVQHLNFSRFWHCDVSYVFEAQSLNKREFNLFIRFFFFITSKAHKKRRQQAIGTRHQIAMNVGDLMIDLLIFYTIINDLHVSLYVMTPFSSCSSIVDQFQSKLNISWMTRDYFAPIVCSNQ